MLCSRIIGRHVHVLNLAHKTKVQYVANLDDPNEVAEARSQEKEFDEKVKILEIEDNETEKLLNQ